MSTLAIYYLETNLICMLFMGYVLYAYVRESRGLTEARWFIASIIGVEVYCLSDILAAFFKNQTFAGARPVLMTANTIYITIPLFLSIVWQYYFNEHMRRYYDLGKTFAAADRIFLIIASAVGIASISSPITHFSFYLDELNGYHRGIGAYIVPLTAYIFLMMELYKARLIEKYCDSLEAKTDARAMSLLPIPCIFFSLLQVFFYGITTAQVGFAMGYMIVYMSRQQNSISRDELTGLSNRRQFTFAVDRLSRSTGSALVAMIDVDDFKHINDTWGHPEGDVMLRAVADALQKVCNKSEMPGRFTVYRYGGDEFVILSSSFNGETVDKTLLALIEEEVSAWNREKDVPYSMSLSVGIAHGKLNEKSIQQLLDKADEEMYTVKNFKKAGR